MAFELKSRSFADGEDIPPKHTADGAGVSPPLTWSGAPGGVKSFALVVHDPDARDWVHWVLYNLPASANALPENAIADVLPEGTRQGLNETRRMGWVGPSPPSGKHRYVFTLYALGMPFYGLVAPTRAQLLKAMHGRILGEARLTGLYERGSRVSPEANV